MTVSVERKLYELLSKRVAGVRKVTNEYGLICVYVRSAGQAHSVRVDLLLSRGFDSVNVQRNFVEGGFIVVGCPKRVAAQA